MSALQLEQPWRTLQLRAAELRMTSRARFGHGANGRGDCPLGALAVALLTPTRRYLPEVSLALLVAVVALVCYEDFAVTPREAGDPMWQYVVSTFEP